MGDCSNQRTDPNMATEHKKVLLTGATGYIAGQLLSVLREHYDLRLVDVRDTNRAGETVPGVEIVDVLDGDRPELEAVFDGIDTVVHCGYVRPRPDHAYEDERRNVDLMQRVYNLSVSQGVKRVVAASTNQAAKWYEHPWQAGRRDRVHVEEFARPESLYGWAKAAYESLGFVYATGAFGRKLEVIQIRIVAPREIDVADFEGKPLWNYLRDITGYISERDLQQLFRKSIDTPEIEDEHGIPFHVFYGVSNNARTFWSIANARQVIGYAPEDDSEIRFADDIARMIARG
jgi:hypothetical protein